ncbi:MAG: beta-lactamase family protein, partial [Gemmatimonadetes bacterium]|nr:beta-lactamase family protein [Gemmatimonadota bacterium]
AEHRAPVTTGTVLRIASMTKSFTALAILRLRDQGLLALDDPVVKWIPELDSLAYPTSDSPVLTIRHLLTHSEGLPEDNPWGDRQLARSDSLLGEWLRAGIPFSTVPGLAYEYSNYGFAILGRIVARVSGMPYDRYLAQEILRPLGLTHTTLQLEQVPDAERAHGYRRTGAAWAEEVPLAHGAFGAMGGLWTDLHDLARYVAFHMSAWPPRDEPERGPVRRASVREMQQPWRASPASALRAAPDAPLALNSGAYGYGLRIAQTCTIRHMVAHGGGLPGYGSLMRWLPEHGVGMVAMGNLTYASFAGLFDEITAELERTGGLQARQPQPSPELRAAQQDITRLVTEWRDRLAQRIAADTLFLDDPASSWQARLRPLAARHGRCPAEPGMVPEHAQRGSWRMGCARGWLNVSITLAPTRPARVQYLSVQSVLPPDAQLNGLLQQAVALVNGWDAAAAARLASPGLDLARLERQVRAAGSAWGRCNAREPVSGDGSSTAELRLACERGPLLLRATLAAGEPRFTRLELIVPRDQSCVL